MYFGDECIDSGQPIREPLPRKILKIPDAVCREQCGELGGAIDTEPLPAGQGQLERKAAAARARDQDEENAGNAASMGSRENRKAVNKLPPPNVTCLRRAALAGKQPVAHGMES